MKKLMSTHEFRTWLSILLLLAAGIVIFHLVSESSIIFSWLGAFFGIISPFIFGFMIAYVLNIPREGFEGLLEKVKQPFVAKRKRGLSIVLTYLSLVAVVVLLSNLIIPRVYDSAVDFIAFFPNLINMAEEFLTELDQNDSVPFFNLADLVANFNWDAVLSYFSLENITTALNAIVNVTGFVFRAALALISSIYFLVSGERLKAFVKRVFKVIMSANIYKTFVKYGREINTYFKRYIFCQVLDGVILGTIMTVVMSVMGIQHAFFLGPLLGFANLIPYFGSIFGTIFAIIVIILTDGTQMGLIATIVLVAIQQLDANFIFPRLLGGSMKIPPLLVIIAIAIGMALYGVLGMIIAIPIVTVLRNIVDDILTYAETRKEGKNREVYGDEQK